MIDKEKINDTKTQKNRLLTTFDCQEIATDQWGVHVEKVEIKDVKLPVQMQRAMAAEAEATRVARSKVTKDLV